MTAHGSARCRHGFSMPSWLLDAVMACYRVAGIPGGTMGMRQPGYTWRRGAWFRARAAGPGGSHDADLGAGRDAGLGAGGGLGAGDGLGADLSAGGGLGAGDGLGADLSEGGRLGARPGIASRPSGWPVLRTPKWMLAAAVVLVAG